MSDFSNNSGEGVRAGVGGESLERADEEVALGAGSGGGKRRHGKDKNCPKNQSGESQVKLIIFEFKRPYHCLLPSGVEFFNFLSGSFDGILIWFDHGNGAVLVIEASDVENMIATETVFFDLPVGSLIELKTDKVGELVFG